jgi:hypothetical protein
MLKTSLYSQLVTLNLKLDTGLQALEQLSQLLTQLIAELQHSSRECTSNSILDPTLPDLLHQLSGVRQLLHQAYGHQALLEANPLKFQEIADTQLVGNGEGQDLPHDFRHPVIPHEVLHHKDVLEDEDSFGVSDNLHPGVSDEMQMRRLMAQLTAAYNRIAALEEQLLFSHRPSYASEEHH